MIFFNSSTHLALHGLVGAVISSEDTNYCIIILLSSTLEREVKCHHLQCERVEIKNKSRINFKAT